MCDLVIDGRDMAALLAGDFGKEAYAEPQTEPDRMHPHDAPDPSAFEEPLFTMGVAAQDQTQTVHVEIATPGSDLVEVRKMTRRQLINEIGRCGAILSARDACKVDPRFASRHQQQILVRNGAVLVSLGSLNLGAVVMREKLYLLAPNARHPLLTTTKSCLRRLLCGVDQRARGESAVATAAAAAAAASYAAMALNSRVPSPPPPMDTLAVPFALSALEGLLMGACTELHRRTTELAAHVREELDELTSHGGIQLTVGTDWLGIVRELRQRVDDLQSQARGLDEALSQV